MPSEYECWCDQCGSLQNWTSDDHDGWTCPSCGRAWTKPLPLPSRWLVEELDERDRLNRRDARLINIGFAIGGMVAIVVLVVMAVMMQ